MYLCRFFTFFLLLFFVYPANGQDILPKGLTEEEKDVYEDYITTYEYGTITRPPDEPPRTPAEFEESGGVIVTWAAYYYELREIVRHSRKRVPVYIVTSNPSAAQSYLENGGVPLEGISFVQIPYNSVWVRDYGPQSIYIGDDDDLGFIDWVYNRPHRPDDNLVPYNMADYLDLPIHQMTTEPDRLVHTGGNLMVDGHGKAFSSKLVLSENPNKTEEEIDEIMYDYMGVETYVKMDELPFDNISHLDMHMKLLDEETLLVAEFPEGVSDGPYIEENLEYLLDNYQTAYDRDFEVVRIPMVPNQQGQYPPQAHYRTYTNSLIVNDLVLVPQYWDDDLNEEAIEIYEEAMPGYEIVGIDMEGVIGASGAIHCISKEIAATDPIFISHASIRESFCNEKINIEAEIDNAAGIIEAYLFWSDDGGSSFQEEEMILENDVYMADIPAQPCNTEEVLYYISATNDNDKTINKPLVAPDGTYTFEIICDGGIDFTVDKDSVMLFDPVEFTYTGCLDDFEDVEWEFGDGANPATATTIGPHEVYYETKGYKTVTLTIDEESITKEDIVYVTMGDSYVLNLEAYPEEAGNVEGDGLYEENEEVEIIADAKQGWEFDEWTGDTDYLDDPGSAEAMVTMPDQDIELIANFSMISTVEEITDIEVKIFPNPAANEFYVESNELINEVKLISVSGQVIKNIAVDGFQSEINVSNLHNGVYFMQIHTPAGFTTKRVQVAR